MAFADLNQLRIHYELTGDPSLPVLVLSHSLGVNLSMWDPQLPALAASFRVLRYDTRGHGKSSVPAGPYMIADLGGDVLGLLDVLGIEQFSFCGLSMGGVIGQWLGIHAPGRLRQLILASTAAQIGTAETWNARIATVAQDGLNSVISGTLERWFTADFRASAPETIADIATMVEATTAQGYTACCAAIRDADFRADISSITTSTLIISGSEDPATPPRDGQFLAQGIAAAKYVELPGAHLCNVQAAAQFNTVLLDFLTV
jgi:3-oxoadipate enol-lactonase